MTTAAKAFEAADAVRNGADEIDMVINLAMVKDGCWDEVAADIAAVREAIAGKILKVIIETCLLTQEEKIRLCQIVSDSGADFIKTSTGFSTGGISALEDAEDMIRLGADRLGTSRIVKIAASMENA